jgi:hypothetical protein
VANILTNGKIESKEHVENKPEIEIELLETGKALKSLRVDENHNTEHQDENTRLKKEYLRRIRPILRAELSAKNKCNFFTRSASVPI